MSLFMHKEFDCHEQVSFFHCPKTGLKAIIAVHNTNRGPALGGCRMWAYENDEQAINDVLRLSRGMTYKAAITDLPLGGGKSVIIGDSRKNKTADLMKAMGTAVERMGGRYIVAEDVGTTSEDMGNVHTQTQHVVGLEETGGDPSPVTAYGVFVGLKAAVKHRLGKDSVKGVKIAVQGLGNVGYNLSRHLHDEGAILTVTDIQQDKMEQAAQEFGATPVALEEIYDVEADVFAPCALGAIINDETIPRIKANVIAGAANNQLAEARHGDVLRKKNVLYTPDYVINAGGLINVHHEYLERSGTPYVRDNVMKHVEKIGETITQIFKKAEQEDMSTADAADRIAESRFEKAKRCEAA